MSENDKHGVDGGGLRYDTGKCPIHLVPPAYIRAAAWVFGYGAKKYEPWNWARGMPWTKVYDCLQRHLLAWYEGEENDKESGLPHLWHAACNIAILIQYANTFKQGDDRPTILRVEDVVK